jgi:hypothetical protein
MAEINTGNLTQLDHAKRVDPDGSIAAIAEVLNEENPILADAPMKQGNLPTGHRSTRRAALPSVGWRRLNEGVSPSKSRTEQVQDVCGILEAWCVIDEKVAALNGNTAAFQMSEAKAFLEAMSQEFTETFFYGNSGTAEAEFDGLAMRYASPTGNQNVLDAGSSDTDNTSIYLIAWGDAAHLITPQGSPTGLYHKDWGLQVVDDAGAVAGAKMSAYQHQFRMEAGLHIKDPRYVVRIGSIDVSVLGGVSPADLLTLMSKALWRLPNDSARASARFYLNRTVGQYLDLQRQDRMEGSFQYREVDGQWVPFFRNVPIRITDAISNSETAV